MALDTPTVPPSRFHAILAGPRGKRKLEALLAATDAQAAVAALPASELYQLICEIGLADASELVALATPEQIRSCVDFEIWDRDQVQIEALKPWLRTLLENGHEQFAQVWQQLDSELTALTLARLVRIYDLTQDEVPDERSNRPVVRTPDTFFAIEIPSGDEDTVTLVLQIIDALYRADPSGALARHAILAARSEPMAELEDTSYRWRSGRMADLGYVDFYEALEVFRPLDPDSVTIGEGTEDRFVSGDIPQYPTEVTSTSGIIPISMVEGMVGRAFLAQALDRINTAEELHRLEFALLVLVNKVMAAGRVSPGDAEALKLGAEHASATLALGLEFVSQGNVERAVAALQSISLTRLHRVGYTITVRMTRMAGILKPRAAAAGSVDTAVLAALGGRRPWFPRVLDTELGPAPGSEPGSASSTGRGPGAMHESLIDVRPFESLDDVRRVAEVLTQLALRIAVVDSLGVDVLSLASQSEPELDDYVRTALVWAMLGGPFTPTPLSKAELVRCRRAAMSKETLSSTAREAAAEALMGSLDKARVTAGREFVPELLNRWLADIEASLAPLPAEVDEAALDLRFIGGVIVASSAAAE